MNADGSATSSCCSMRAIERFPAVAGVSPLPTATEDHTVRVVVPGGKTQIGTSRPVHADDGESPVRHTRISTFELDEAAVTNDRFARFVASTGYITEAERFGWSFVFFDMLPAKRATPGVIGSEWWRRVDGACWRLPEGPDSNLSGRGHDPVTHISWHDAAAFAVWAGGHLPSEAQWEHAARGGLGDVSYPWGDQAPDDQGFVPCNIWQGEFPRRNLAVDGYRWLAPARSFQPNGYGLFNMSGNCWEWTADSWRVRSLKSRAKAQNSLAARDHLKVMKGGSFLCHASYCHRYRIAARHSNTPDTSTSHIGFRVAYDMGQTVGDNAGGNRLSPGRVGPR